MGISEVGKFTRGDNNYVSVLTNARDVLKRAKIKKSLISLLSTYYVETIFRRKYVIYYI